MKRIKIIPVKVECHSGHKADEYPTCFYLNDKRFDIRQIVDRWYQSDQHPDFPAADYFKVLTNQNQQFLLKHEWKLGRWLLIVPDEPLYIQFSYN